MPMPRPPATACRSWLIALLALLPAVSARAELPAALARQLADAGVPSDAVGLVVAPVAPGPRFWRTRPSGRCNPARR
jgi:hypothetical protein